MVDQILSSQVLCCLVHGVLGRRTSVREKERHDRIIP